jgi:hypothetical protein
VSLKIAEVPLIPAAEVSTATALLAVGAIANSRNSFVAAVQKIERTLVDAGLSTGLVVLEKRGLASFPLAGNGGPAYRSPSDAIYSRSIRLATRHLKIILFVRTGRGRHLHFLADFVAEQLASLAKRSEPGVGLHLVARPVRKIG